MTGDEIIQTIYDAMNSTDIKLAQKQMMKILKEDGFYAFETDDELRELALTDTDLIEPE